MPAPTTPQKRRRAVGQLSLVEHSLCPLDPKLSMVPNLVHDASYRYTDCARRRQTANARVFCPLGLSAHDEVYLWGLLALALTRREPDNQLFATPYWCLRELGMLASRMKRGGRQYQQFRDALRRLSVVSYLNDAFYDPVRAEHREISFGLLSFSLPADPDSSRAWKIVFDPVFFEMVQCDAGHLRFDLELYRQLDPASRRLFLFARKVFFRRRRFPTMSVHDLGVGVMGFSETLAPRHLRSKVAATVARLVERDVLGSVSIEPLRRGEYVAQIAPGPYLAQLARDHASPITEIHHDALVQTLVTVGFDQGAAVGLVRRFSRSLLEEWADITLAARERFGEGFFRRSAMAFLVDSVRHAAAGTRTAPDWWHDLRRQEQNTTSLSQESRQVFARLQREIFQQASADRPETPLPSGVTLAGQVLRSVPARPSE